MVNFMSMILNSATGTYIYTGIRRIQGHWIEVMGNGFCNWQRKITYLPKVDHEKRIQ